MARWCGAVSNLSRLLGELSHIFLLRETTSNVCDCGHAAGFVSAISIPYRFRVRCMANNGKVSSCSFLFVNWFYVCIQLKFYFHLFSYATLVHFSFLFFSRHSFCFRHSLSLFFSLLNSAFCCRFLLRFCFLWFSSCGFVHFFGVSECVATFKTGK